MNATPPPRGPAPRCPFCESEQTELMSLFGSSALTSQYYCRACRSAFEQVKWGTMPPAAVPPASPLDGTSRRDAPASPLDGTSRRDAPASPERS